MAPSYSANLQKFINNYQTFESQIGNYETKLDEFYTQMETLINHADSNLTPGIISGTNDNTYLKTKNGALLYVGSSFNNKEKDFTINKLNDVSGTDYFYVDPRIMRASDASYGTPSKNYYTDTIIQGGLEDLSFNMSNLVDVSYNKLVPESHIFKYVNDGDCSDGQQNSLLNIYKCDSYARLNNKKYYGLSRHDNSDGATMSSKCACYIFDNITNYDNNSINVYSEPTGIDNISYLGIMFDNTLCSLKDEIFSNNFEKAYVTIGDNVNQLEGTYKLDNCNKFTGSGVYNVDIYSLNSKSSAINNNDPLCQITGDI